MVDRRENIQDPLASKEAMLDGRQAQIWTMMPGILQSYDVSNMTCKVQVAIQCQQRDPQGKWTNVSISVLADCPVSFPRGGGYGCTFPLAEGDEGMVVFASRCLDAWWQSGGVQPQAELRMHDLSDGCFVPGICSQPNVPAGVSTNALRLWKEDDSMYVELSGDTETITVKATNIVLDGAVNFAPGATITGPGGIVDFGTTKIKQGGKFIDHDHTHNGVQTGGGVSGPVT